MSHGKFKSFFFVTIIYTKVIEKKWIHRERGRADKLILPKKDRLRHEFDYQTAVRSHSVWSFYRGRWGSAMQRKGKGGHARIADGDPLVEEAKRGVMNSGEESFFLVGFSGLDMVGSQEDKKLTRESGSQSQRC